MVNGIVDTVTGTLRLGARDYDPVTGRFTQPDPILDPADPTQWNAYAYGANNPVDRPDPDGLFSAPNPGVMYDRPDSGALHETTVDSTTSGPHGHPTVGAPTLGDITGPAGHVRPATTSRHTSGRATRGPESVPTANLPTIPEPSLRPRHPNR